MVVWSGLFALKSIRYHQLSGMLLGRWRELGGRSRFYCEAGTSRAPSDSIILVKELKTDNNAFNSTLIFHSFINQPLVISIPATTLIQIQIQAADVWSRGVFLGNSDRVSWLRVMVLEAKRPGNRKTALLCGFLGILSFCDWQFLFLLFMKWNWCGGGKKGIGLVFEVRGNCWFSLTVVEMSDTP